MQAATTTPMSMSRIRNEVSHGSIADDKANGGTAETRWWMDSGPMSEFELLEAKRVLRKREEQGSLGVIESEWSRTMA